MTNAACSSSIVTYLSMNFFYFGFYSPCFRYFLIVLVLIVANLGIWFVMFHDPPVGPGL